jgi:hypothetical protein
MKSFYQICLYTLFSGFFLLTGCTRKTITTQTDTKNNKYQEDLSSVRPKYRIESQNTVPPVNKNTSKASTNTIIASDKKFPMEITSRLNAVLDTIAVRNRVIKSAPGYRVQIYVGDSREEALEARAKSYNLLKDETPYLIPMLPSYRVRVGDFLDKLEAQKAYTILLREFPNALVVPDKIEIKRFSSDDK